MDEILRQWLAWLNDGSVKYGLLILGGFLLKRWPAFVNKAIAISLAFVSALLALGHALFPTVVPAGTVPSEFVAASFMGQHVVVASSTGSQVASWAWNTFFPLAAAIATQSGVKNTIEWLRLGVGLFWPGGKPRS